MKKIITLLLCLIFMLTPLSVFATDGETTEKEIVIDNSTPRFMVTSYKLESDSITPDSKTNLQITFKNYSSTKGLYNIKLTLSDPSGEILTTGMPTKYVKSVSAGYTYTWDVEVMAVNTATIGQHDLQVTAEYEDKNYNSYSSNDTVRVNVCQPVELSYSGAILPKKVVQGNTQTVAVELMNTGKSTLYNCTLQCEVDKMQTGGSVYVGNIEPATSSTGNVNLRIDDNALGEVKGKIIITYEDDYGEKYEETVDVSTVIEEKVEQLTTDEDDEKEKKNPQWWLFLTLGFIVGGTLGFGIPWYINDKKQRKEDDLRL